MSRLGKAEFGVSTFFAASYPNDKCGANGLPLTPNSIKVLGRFQNLKTFEHPAVCKYLDIVKTKNERLIVVSEHYTENLSKVYQTGKFSSETTLLPLIFEILQGLEYLNGRGVTHRNLSLHNILFTSEGKVKLSEYGMYYMTDAGSSVSFPIGHPKYMAPEILCGGPTELDDTYEANVQHVPCFKVDTWSLGIILMEAFTGKELWENLPLEHIFEKVMKILDSNMDPLDVISQDQGIEKRLHELSKDGLDFLRLCLTRLPSKRPTPAALRKHPFLRELRLKEIPYKNGYPLFSAHLRCADLELPVLNEDANMNDLCEDHLSERSMEEVYYLWRLAGGDLETALRKAGLIKTNPPITLLPSYVSPEGEVYGQPRDDAELLENTVVILSQEQLRNRLKDIEETAYYPLLEDESSTTSAGLPTSPSSGDLTDTASLPLVIREKDVEYQFHRIILYERLLKAYPYKRPHIWQEARVDIPPLVRAHVWAALLEVEGDIEALYDSIDKETPTATDRQIEVDIPRCHQYHELLSSPAAHTKFRRILKAWVVSHPEYVYWQGLDSLCAPFLALNFNNEALAFSCLSSFIPKYLHKFFLKDNSAVIQEYLAVFTHLISFHDPELGNHLDGIGFIPDLYAIPWFLTMYAHVFPLHKIMHLWDTLLLGNSSLPLCIGVAILQQLRDRLLSFGFNECILLFSDMPEIDIERCVKDSVKIFCTTPKSATYRHHARPARPRTSASRPKLSYYSQDYNESPQNDLSMEALTLEELKSEKAPRISAEDLIELGELMGSAPTRSPTKKKQNSKPMILVVDVRSVEEYKRGTIPNSINIPFLTAFSPEGDLVMCPAVQALNASRGQVRVIIGNRGRNAANFAAELIRLGYSRTCVLHKGVDVFRQTGLLTVPPADL